MSGDTTKPARRGPLANYRVLDLGVLFAGPMVASVMADYGADVVKVELSDIGDPLRRYGWGHKGQDSLYWKFIGRGKRTIALDLRSDEGRETTLRLAAAADVVVENFRPGVLERWGLGWDALHALNPRLVLVRLTGFGQEGPYRDKPGFGTVAEAMSGFAHINGWPDRPPLLPPFGLADGIAALAATVATVNALLWRDTVSGEGQQIDVAITDPLFSILGPQAAAFTELNIAQARSGNRTPFVTPRGAYRCSDGAWIALSGATDAVAFRVLRLIGGEALAADSRFATNLGRNQHADELDALIQNWVAQRTCDEAIAAMSAVEAAAGPVYSIDQILADPHFQARQMFVDVPDEDLGTVTIPNIMARMSATPSQIRFAGRRPNADRGDVLLDWLGVKEG